MTKPQAHLPKELETQITTSRVVHDSVDKFYRRKEGLPIPDPAPIDSQAGTGSNTPAQNGGEAVQPESVVEEEGEAEGGGQGSVSTSAPNDAQPQIKNTRPAEAADGIATYDELVDTIRTLLPNGLESSYLSYDSPPDQMDFGKRDGFKATFSTIPDGLAGHDEPAYTCYTSLFQLTLGKSDCVRLRVSTNSIYRLPFPLLRRESQSHSAATTRSSRRAGQRTAQQGNMPE